MRVVAQLLQRGDGRQDARCLTACEDAADLLAVKKVLLYSRLCRSYRIVNVNLYSKTPPPSPRSLTSARSSLARVVTCE
jgi:hypothetical protein